MWDERFGQDDYVYGEEPNTFLVEQLGRQELSDLSGTVLCLYLKLTDCWNWHTSCKCNHVKQSVLKLPAKI